MAIADVPVAVVIAVPQTNTTAAAVVRRIPFNIYIYMYRNDRDDDKT